MSRTLSLNPGTGAPVFLPGRPLFVSVLVVILLALGAVRSHAQAAPSEESARWERIWAGGLHFLGPVDASLAVGPALRRKETGPDDPSRLLFLFLEPGFGGQRVSLGYGQSVGHLAGGWSLRASLLKLTGEPARRTLMGIELQAIAVLCAGVRAGAFRETGHRDRTSTIILADISLCL